MKHRFQLAGIRRHGRRTTMISRTRHHGFTLIEMLVSAALTVLIMSLFAQIFALATSSIRDQRNIARHDQKARIVAQTLNLDLAGRTFRQRADATGLSRGIVPLIDGIPVDRANQRGYFYYSENDPRNNVDDVLQLTVDLREVDFRTDSRDQPPPQTFVGRATDIPRSGALTARAAGTADLDQPEWDDGVGSRLNASSTIVPGNGQTQSPAAEISYFVRGGNLYRRVLLLRNPSNNRGDGQPSVPNEGPLMSLARVPDGTLAAEVMLGNYVSGNWYNDFDVAATRIERDPENDGLGDTDGDGVGTSLDPGMSIGGDFSAIYLHTLNSLDNDTAVEPIALPWNRFGHLPLADRDVDRDGTPDFAAIFELRDSTGNPFVNPITGANEVLSYVAGQPYEFLKRAGATAERTFIGRYTHGETSSPLFSFPGAFSAAGTHAYHSAVLELDDELADSDGSEASNQDPSLIDEFEAAGMPREGEDLILTNVVGFDVEIWDDVLSQFVDLGQPSTNGNTPDGGVYTDATPDAVPVAGSTFIGFQNASRKNTVYGPSIPPFNRVFDTWHPAAGSPPILVTRRLVENAAASGSETPHGIAGLRNLANTWRNTTAGRYEGVWDSANTYQLNDTVIPDVTIPPYQAAPVAYGDAPTAGSSPATQPVTSQIVNRLFRAVPIDTSVNPRVPLPAGASVQVGNIQPNWEDAVINGFVDQFSLTSTNIGVRWFPVSDSGRRGFAVSDASDLVGLKKMRITITLADAKTGNIRDVTLVHSFVE